MNVDGRGSPLREDMGRLAAPADLEVALKGDPSDFETHYLIGLGRMQLGEYKGAADAFSEVIKREPQLAEAYYLRGRCYEELGDDAKADLDYLKRGEMNSSR